MYLPRNDNTHKKIETMKTFYTLLVMACMVMTIYNYVMYPEDIRQLIFWSVLTLFNNQELHALKRNSNDNTEQN